MHYCQNLGCTLTRMEPTLRQLAAFAAVAQECSFTVAASKLNVSQSTLSRSVADLERHLGCQLLDRDTRKVSLTPVGVEARRVAEDILKTHKASISSLNDYIVGRSGTVAVATLPSIAAVLMPHVIKTFRSRGNNLSVRIIDGVEGLILNSVAAGDAHFGISTGGGGLPALRFRPWIQDDMVVIAPTGHPLLDSTSVRWSDLAELPFLAVGKTSSVRRLTDAAFTQAGVSPVIAAEASNVATVGGLVTAGLGISAVPSLVLPLMATDALDHRPLVQPVVSRHLGVVERRTGKMPPIAQEFLGMLEQAAELQDVLPRGVSWATASQSPRRRHTT